ncbi:transposase [Protofrankia symbiont of Coriaria ruscifolia]|uniref:transposase n=1 Tax=Protofrankia symbiont of Coriaria ruscifolia TaxID=1306542 RepID=UPI001A948891|nr:transposase [Protofrankia symbiont of Coriaria ruscifolia]
MDDHTNDATRLLDLDGLEVRRVELFPDGSRQVWLQTADDTARACPRCGVFADRVKGVVATRPRDLPCGSSPLRLVWVKRRWYCREPGCPRGSFTESLPAVPPRARLTARLREAAGTLVVDGICATVVAGGRHLGLSWPTVMDAVRDTATPLTGAATPPVEVLGIDETRRGRPRWRGAISAPEPAAPPEPAGSGPTEPTPTEPTPEPLPAGPAGVAMPAKARVLADRWHVGFTDLAGGHGMLGQVEGRTADDVAYRLASQPVAWRHRIRYVAIDMCTVFAAAVRRYLSHATLIVDHFHLVQLANDAVAEIRRRVTTLLRGRRVRDSDPEWKIRNLLRRNRENLAGRQLTKPWNTLVDLGEPGQTILAAWIGKEELRAMLALAGTHPDRTVIAHRLTRFYTWCADAGIPELERLATTISTWWPCIEAFLHTGITNAGSEGYNRVVKLDARNAFGYRNPPTSGYEHAAQPPAEPANASTPLNFDEPAYVAHPNSPTSPR